MDTKEKKLTKRQRILNSPTRLVEEAENCLAALWRIILKDLNITEEKWNLLMNIYLTDPVNGFNTETRVLGDKRGNLNKALCGTKVQMLIFNRALRFLQTERAILTFTIHSIDSKKYPPATYNINILYGKESRAQLESALKEDIVSVKAPLKKRRFMNSYREQTLDVITKKYSGEYALDQWLEDPNKKISSATGPLSKIWRKILSDRSVDKSMWKSLTTKYQRLMAPECDIIRGNETHEELKAKSKKKSNIKGNITDELQRPSFTIDVFMKGMVFIDIERVDISIRLKRLNSDRLTTHELKDWDPKVTVNKEPIRDR